MSCEEIVGRAHERETTPISKGKSVGGVVVDRTPMPAQAFIDALDRERDCVEGSCGCACESDCPCD